MDNLKETYRDQRDSPRLKLKSPRSKETYTKFLKGLKDRDIGPGAGVQYTSTEVVKDC